MLGKNKFRKWVKKFIVDEYDIILKSAFEKDDKFILETEHLPTKQTQTFIHYGYYWYLAPDMEKINSSSSLDKQLDNLKELYNKGLFSVLKKENSIRFMTEDD